MKDNMWWLKQEALEQNAYRDLQTRLLEFKMQRASLNKLISTRSRLRRCQSEFIGW